MSYEEIINQLSIQKGDRIWLSSELIKYVLLFRKNKLKFDPSELLNAFQQAIGEMGTLLIPTFSFDFSNKGIYDYKETKGITGTLGNIALQRNDFRRTKHPMHSFAVWGKDAELLVNMNNKHAFGVDSPFGYCLNNNVKQVILGTDYVHAMTFIHYAEYLCDVPYRFKKSFTGTYIDANRQSEERTYDYAARKLEIEPEERFNRLGKILEENGIANQIYINNIENYVIDLSSSYQYICNDIKNNMCRNMYDFNIPREEIFINKEM